MSLTLNLQKSAAALKLNLEKRGINTPPRIELAFNLDVSGSFDDEHRGGLTQNLLNRLVPWGMVFDPDQKLDVFTFSNGEQNAHYVGDITEHTVDGYIKQHIIDKVPGYNGGTDYVHVLRKNLQTFGFLPASAKQVEVKKTGLLGRFFGGGSSTAVATPPTVTATRRAALILHVTDGDNNRTDKDPTWRLMQEAADRGDRVYFLVIGCSSSPATFEYVEKLGKHFPNVGLSVITDLPRLGLMTDDELNDLLITDELITWLKE